MSAAVAKRATLSARPGARRAAPSLAEMRRLLGSAKDELTGRDLLVLRQGCLARFAGSRAQSDKAWRHILLLGACEFWQLKVDRLVANNVRYPAQTAALYGRDKP